ncbi:beta-ketoacyl-ACP synthase III [Ruminococcus flavefaciens]|jgi:3-oxoacyl-[acyl-carrier-protein] synthase-3|uniref:beta-ketoacyl-ACP synthase III n=1 Tax=Ruminococcus flavefaciens TaxID=1265 RepID=UPI0026EA6A61|nr:beta-ketoacyl-ACP synthase III [Ruminococcus flavefaciens]
MGISILGTGSYVPDQIMTNDDFTRFVETDDEWIRTRTGISQRRMAGWEPTWYMGAQASLKAVKASGIDPADIGLIISCTATSDFLTPSMASVIQHEVGAVNAAAFDMNAACSGFVYATDVARRFLETDDSLKYVLVVANEALTRFLDFTDRSSCILFGDGAAAVILEKSDKLYSSALCSDGSGAGLLCARSLNVAPEVAVENSDFEDPFPDVPIHKLQQNGKEVYKFAVAALPKSFELAAAKVGITKDDIDWFVPHQANIRIIETAAKKLGAPMEKFIVTLDHYGNTSSASIPLALCEGIEKGLIKRGQKIALIGFGAGLTYGGIIFEY